MIVGTNPLLGLSKSKNFIEYAYGKEIGCYLHIHTGLIVMPSTKRHFLKSGFEYTGGAELHISNHSHVNHDIVYMNDVTTRNFVNKHLAES